MKATLVWAVLVSLSLLAGCSALLQPVYNVESSPVSVPLTADEVARAIVVGGVGLGWKMEKTEPGRIEGTLQARESTANITIKYDATHYSITYKDSTNMKYEAGNIHFNYNKWIRTLDKRIQQTLILGK